MKLIAYNIEYDTDGKRIDLPEKIKFDIPSDEEDIVDFVSNKISENTGFCHKGFKIKFDNDNEEEFSDRKIESFWDRKEAQRIYENIFDCSSDSFLDFEIFDTLYSYGVLSEEDSDYLTNKMDELGNNLWDEIRRFDKIQLKNYENNKS